MNVLNTIFRDIEMKDYEPTTSEGETTNTNLNPTKASGQKVKEVDMVKLNEISDEYLSNKKEWNNIENIEKRLIELNEQLDLSKEESTKNQIKDIINRYEYQNKYLLQIEIEKNRNRGKAKSNEKLEEGKKKQIEIITIDDEDSVMTCIKNKDEKNHQTNIQQNALDKDNQKRKNSRSPKGSPKKSVKIAGDKNGYFKKSSDLNDEKMKNIPNDSNINNKIKCDDGNHNIMGTIKNPYTRNKDIKEENNMKRLASDLFKNKEKKDTTNEKNEEQKNKEIRIRFQFTANGTHTTSTEEQVQTILYKIMKCAKEIDPNAALNPWKMNSRSRPINGLELKLFKNQNIMDYIDMPKKNIISGKVYYQNGLCIKTNIEVSNFVDIWNNKRYEEPKNEKMEWIPIKQAEMQYSDTSFPLGYFVGTTERGDYTTIQMSLKKKFGPTIELSFQLLNQQGVSPKIWEYARKKASEINPNQQSKEHKRQKFKYAPSALVIYTSDKAKVKEIRRNLTKEYGKLQEKLWPEMEDGSKMRFIPLLPGYVKDKMVYKHLYRQMWLQSQSKSGEVKLDIKIRDIKTPKTYLNNQSLEQVIHKVESKTKERVPLFKHIIKKWTREANNDSYQVVVAPCLVDEGIHYIRGMKNNLVKLYGKEILEQLNEPNPHLQYNNITESDKEIEELISVLEEEDPISKVLIEGMDLIINDENEKGINENILKLPEEKMKEENNNRKKPNEENTMLNTRATWEEMTLIGELECTPSSEKEKKKVRNTLKRLEIKIKEIENWKNTNWSQYDDILEKCNNKEYEIIKLIVESIIRDRDQEMNNNKEINVVNSILSLIEEEEIDNKNADVLIEDREKATRDIAMTNTDPGRVEWN